MGSSGLAGFFRLFLDAFVGEATVDFFTMGIDRT